MSVLSINAQEWLQEWINCSGNDTLAMTQRLLDNNSAILNEFINIQHSKRQYYKSIILFRGTKNRGDTYVLPTNRITSWSHSMRDAELFGNYVYECTFTNDDILIDTTLIDISFYFDENEVIILPSTNKIARLVKVIDSLE